MKVKMKDILKDVGEYMVNALIFYIIVVVMACVVVMFVN